MSYVSPVPQSKLAHMRPGEISLFRRFEILDPLAPAEYEFDLHLGRGMPIDPSWPRWLQLMATRLTQKRVDVVAYTKTATWILEIKIRAGPAAVGQLVTYLSLFIHQCPSPLPTYVAIIADRNSYDMFQVYETLGISLFLV
ncbi:hypothetical protein ES708_14227 [subsurface metagenome]